MSDIDHRESEGRDFDQAINTAKELTIAIYYFIAGDHARTTGDPHGVLSSYGEAMNVDGGEPSTTSVHRTKECDCYGPPPAMHTPCNGPCQNKTAMSRCGMYPDSPTLPTT